MPSQPGNSPLEAYRAKRSAERTAEPYGSGDALRPGLFVVQKHAARQLHYDLRIEIDGTLRSWAIPKGPSLDPSEKRFAVATEDHPVEYGEFEGLIPKGNYGAGAMILWDRGLCVPHLNHAEGLRSGKLLFELRGYKLRGLWTLVRTRREREWLLIKKPDAWASGDDACDLPAESVFSGLTVEEMLSGTDRATEIHTLLEEVAAPKRHVSVDDLEVMLATLHRGPAFDRQDWLFEIKYDGFRMVAAKGEVGSLPREQVTLRYRSGHDATHLFPDLARAVAGLPYRSLIMDGEIVILDDEGRPNFQDLQQRARLSRARDIERAAIEQPAALVLFDLLAFESFDLRTLSLRQRKEILRKLLPRAGPLRFADHLEDRGKALYEEIRKLEIEGMMAKNAAAAYQSGRSPDWLKIRADRVGDFVVVGFRPASSKKGFRALHLGVIHGARLTYAGRVGAGFGDAERNEIRARLNLLECPVPAFEGRHPTGEGETWVKPKIVVEVRFTEHTRAGHLRHPVYQRLRDDKRPTDCLREDLPPPPEVPIRDLRDPAVRITRRDKVFWPEEGYTKGDLLDYYAAISPWLLPYLQDRPLVLDRYPDGIGGKSFFQRNAPDFTPEWVRTEPIWTEGSAKETRHFVCDDERTLLYLVNLGSIPLHLWSSRIAAIQRPDWCILDLDAKQAPFAYVIEVALAIRRLCKELKLPCGIKTSGATGMHVLIPLAGRCTFEQSRQLAELIARLIAEALPEIASISRLVATRREKVYVDFLQNGYGKLLVAPLSVRPLAGAPVSMPLRWREVTERLDPTRFDLRSAPKRLERLAQDPLRTALEGESDLERALTRLAEKVR